MELPPTTAATAAARRTDAGYSDAGAAANELAGDFETFLSLLTAQLKNQDPLKPMESTEFVAQLANFSSVEQQVRTNDRLDEIAAALGGDTATGLAAWIGREVRAPGKAAFAGVPVEMEVQPLKDVDQAVLVVRNDFDQVVARRAVDPAAASVVWDGTNEAGTEAAHGIYSFQLETYRDEALVDTQQAQVFGAVAEVRMNDGAPVLVLDNGERVSLDDVTGLR